MANSFERRRYRGNYQLFSNILNKLYEKYFPYKEYYLRPKDLKSPWITIGLRKSSKQKQRLYEKFLKKRTVKREAEYKDYKHLFEKIKKNAKRRYYSDK